MATTNRTQQVRQCAVVWSICWHDSSIRNLLEDFEVECTMDSRSIARQWSSFAWLGRGGCGHPHGHHSIPRGRGTRLCGGRGALGLERHRFEQVAQSCGDCSNTTSTGRPCSTSSACCRGSAVSRRPCRFTTFFRHRLAESISGSLLRRKTPSL